MGMKWATRGWGLFLTLWSLSVCQVCLCVYIAREGYLISHLANNLENATVLGVNLVFSYESRLVLWHVFLWVYKDPGQPPACAKCSFCTLALQFCFPKFSVQSEFLTYVCSLTASVWLRQQLCDAREPLQGWNTCLWFTGCCFSQDGAIVLTSVVRQHCYELTTSRHWSVWPTAGLGNYLGPWTT